MSHLQLQLPDELHHQLEERAQREGVSLQEYIVESLARVVTVPDLETQRAAFEEMLHRYPEDHAEAALRDLLSSRQ